MRTLYALRGICFATLLEQDGFSRTYVKNSTWRYYYVLTKLLFKSVIYRGGKGGWVTISVEKLSVVLGNTKIKNDKLGINARRRFANQVIDDLVRWNILLKHNLVEPRKDKSTGAFMVNDQGQQLWQTHVALKLKDEVLVRGWHKAQVQVDSARIQLKTEQDRTPLEGVYFQIQRYLPSITIDLGAARAYTDWAYETRLPLRDKQRGYVRQTGRRMGAMEHSYWHQCLDTIEAGDYKLQPPHPDTGRHMTVFSNLPRELRPFLRINGQPLVELDIKNSQPLLFSYLLRQEYANQELPADLTKFIQQVEAGSFYKVVAELLQAAEVDIPDDADYFKISFFARIFFSTESVNYKWRQVFAQHYHQRGHHYRQSWQLQGSVSSTDVGRIAVNRAHRLRPALR
ncbi:hypothetical protein [Hymenobacter sp. CRA2]|uniref:hypothetical protein n=1 Tax=Hymenobacter sp. CRA2 TaxID=1955620 RepID=UPI00098F4957|nr:hypothetical protein [Hymenobacter sp. CRA2]OON69929.1 hypothetical protein B0919_04040 [Hymenobacter sp. CRA2]